MQSPPQISAASVELVRFGVFADSDGRPVDPTALAVSAAFQDDPADAPSSWTAAEWDVTLIGSYTAGVLVGPGALELAAGLWYAWLRIVDPGTDETVVRQVGQLLVC